MRDTRKILRHRRKPIVTEINAYQLWDHAQQYLGAAELIMRSSPQLIFPCYLLVCQSIELGLKAFLRLNGCTTEWLKNRIGHDIKKGLKTALPYGLKLSDENFKLAVAELSPLYTDRQFQYFDRPKIEMPGVESCCKATRSFLEDIRPGCEKERISTLRKLLEKRKSCLADGGGLPVDSASH